MLDFVPVLAQPAGFALRLLGAFETPRNRRTIEAQRLLGTPFSPLSLRAITGRPFPMACTIKMKDRAREQEFSELMGFSLQNVAETLLRGWGGTNDL